MFGALFRELINDLIFWNKMSTAQGHPRTTVQRMGGGGGRERIAVKGVCSLTEFKVAETG